MIRRCGAICLATLRFLYRNAAIVGLVAIVTGVLVLYNFHSGDITKLRVAQTHLAATEHRLDVTQRDLAAIQKALVDQQHTNHAANCAVTQHEWDVLDALIVKVDETNPGVRAQYEPLLGARPIC